MPINYPISSGGGGASGNATQLQGYAITNQAPSNGSMLVWSNDQNEYRLENSLKFNIFAGSSSFSTTSESVLTKFRLIGTQGNPPNQNAFFIIQATVDSPYTGSVRISGSTNEFVMQISSSDFSYFFAGEITGTDIYTVFASSSNASSNFTIYNLLTTYNIS